MKIKISEIEKVINLLLSKLRESVGDEIEIKNDFYWNIPSEELYNPYDEPKNLSLGQLSFDIEEVMRLLESDDAIAYDIQKLSSILIALSIENEIAF